MFRSFTYTTFVQSEGGKKGGKKGGKTSGSNDTGNHDDSAMDEDTVRAKQVCARTHTHIVASCV
jgi:hypothetical protein